MVCVFVKNKTTILYIYIYIRLFKYAIKFHVCGEPLLRWNLQWIMRWQINLLINLQGCCCLQKGLCIFLLRWLIHCFVVCCKSLSFSVSLSHTLSLSLFIYCYCIVMFCLSVSLSLSLCTPLYLSLSLPSVLPSVRLAVYNMTPNGRLRSPSSPMSPIDDTWYIDESRLILRIKSAWSEYEVEGGEAWTIWLNTWRLGRLVPEALKAGVVLYHHPPVRFWATPLSLSLARHGNPGSYSWDSGRFQPLVLMIAVGVSVCVWVSERTLEVKWKCEFGSTLVQSLEVWVWVK